MTAAAIPPSPPAVTCWQLLRAAIVAYPENQDLADRLVERALALLVRS